jgi:hypothetical protein
MPLAVETYSRQNFRVSEICIFNFLLTNLKDKITESKYTNVALLAQLV